MNDKTRPIPARPERCRLLIMQCRDLICGSAGRAALLKSERESRFPYDLVNEAQAFVLDAPRLYRALNAVLSIWPVESASPCGLAELGNPHRVLRYAPVALLGRYLTRPTNAVRANNPSFILALGGLVDRALQARHAHHTWVCVPEIRVPSCPGVSPVTASRLASALYEYADFINLGERAGSLESRLLRSARGVFAVRRYSNLRHLSVNEVIVLDQMQPDVKHLMVNQFRGKFERFPSLDQRRASWVVADGQSLAASESDQLLYDVLDQLRLVQEEWDSMSHSELLSARADIFGREPYELARALGLHVPQMGGIDSAYEGSWVNTYIDLLDDALIWNAKELGC